MSDRVIGGYALRRVLGRGGMGEVHLATTPTGGLAAVKVIHPGLARDPAFRRRFEREVAAARRVARFCTAPVLDAGLDGDVAYLVTEYVKGPDLAQAVRDQGPLSGGNLDALAVGIATALSAIHAAGVIHRDLKPSNVLLSPLGPRVIDFGIAQLVGSDTSQAILGTPAFMAPEQARGESVGPFTDVFAWGGMIAFAGTGRPPFGGGSPAEVIHRITTEGPRLDGLDGGVRGLVEQALAKDPRARPPVSRLLAELLGGSQVSPASATEAVERTWTTPLTQPSPAVRAAHGNIAGTDPHTPAAPYGGAPGGHVPHGSVDSADSYAPAAPYGGGSGGHVRGAEGRVGLGSGERASGRGRRRWGWVVGGVLAVALVGGGSAVAASMLSQETWPYESDFSDGWEVGASDAGTAGRDASGYVLAVEDGWRLWKSAPRREPGGGSVVSARAGLVEGAGAYGVWCRGTSGDRYEFAVGAGQVTIVKRRAGQEGVVLYGPEKAEAAATDRVVAECAGGDGEVTLRMWLNEHLVAEATDAERPFGPGLAGVHAAPEAGKTVRVRFESFALRPARD